MEGLGYTTMRKRQLIAGALITLLFAQVSYAQVTIGAQKAPANGALLQLKENENIGANSTKGLMMPRVGLVDVASLEPLASDTEAKQHIGAVVFNTTKGMLEPTSACDPTPTISGLTKGLKVWSGDEWEDITSENDNGVIPPDWINPKVKFIKDHEGNIYPVKQFGDEGYWMLENLRTKSVANGRGKYPVRIGTSMLIPEDLAEIELVREARYQYPAPPREYKDYFGDEEYPAISDDAFFKRYPNVGLLYNYFMTLNGEEPQDTEILEVNGKDRIAPRKDANGRPNSFIQGICPDGWHVPFNQEYVTLFEYIDEEFNAGNYDESGIDIDFLNANPGLIDKERYPLTNCLPLGTPELTRGASKIALKGGFAAMWVGADSPFKSLGSLIKDDKFGPKEYGILAVFSTAYDWKNIPVPGGIYSNLDNWVGNFWIRPAGSVVGTNKWVHGKSYLTNMYPVRCKKDDNTASGILSYEDVYGGN